MANRKHSITRNEVIKLAVGQVLVALVWVVAMWLLANHWPHEGWGLLFLGPAVFYVGAACVLAYRWWRERRRWQWTLPLGTVVVGLVVLVAMVGIFIASDSFMFSFCERGCEGLTLTGGWN